MPRTIKTPGEVPEQQPETVLESIATGRPVLTADGWVV